MVVHSTVPLPWVHPIYPFLTTTSRQFLHAYFECVAGQSASALSEFEGE